MKKWFVCMLALVLIVSAVPMGAFRFDVSAEEITEYTEGDYTYTVSNGEATITDCYSSITGDITIPSTLGGYPVAYIDDRAFRWSDNITSVIIPNSVICIGDYAFDYCGSLTSITVPDSVTSIGEYAFRGCDNLTSINVNENNRYYCSIDGVLFNEDKTTVIQYPAGKTNTTYKIPNGVINIGNSAFYYCTSLTGITIPDSVTSIGEEVFYGCDGLVSVKIPDSVTSIGDLAFYSCDNLTSVTISNSVTSISYGAFGYCTSLTSITIPDSVTSIGDRVFSGCESLTTVTLGENVETIGTGTFDYCRGLLKFNVSNKNDNYCSIDGVLFDKAATTLLMYPCAKTNTTYKIPNSVKTIVYRAFYDCDNLTSISIPSSVKSIEWEVFSGCDSLASITIPDTVTSIGGNVFYGTAYYDNDANWVDGCLYIGRYLIDTDYINSTEYNCTVKDGTLVIAGMAFQYSDFEEITIPDSVTNIVYDAFEDCYDIKEFVVDSDNNYYSSIDGALFDKDVTTLLNYPKDSEKSQFIIPSTVKTIDDEVFRRATYLQSVKMPDSVTSIGKYAFSSCTSLKSITIPDSVTSIGDSAFSFCDSLTSVTIGDSVTSIGDLAFFNCSGLKSINIPDSVTSIGVETFSRTGLISVKISNSVTSIGEYTFASCDSLTSVTIPDSITSIDECAFYNSKNLTDVWYYGSETDKESISIGNYNDYLINATWHYNSCVGTSEHTYDNVCDTHCNVCNKIRTVSHVYDNDYDTVCNKCGAEKVKYIVGDTSGDGNINNRDLALLMQYINGWPVEVVEDAADVNADNTVNNRDYALLMQYVNGWPVELK